MNNLRNICSVLNLDYKDIKFVFEKMKWTRGHVIFDALITNPIQALRKTTLADIFHLRANYVEARAESVVAANEVALNRATIAENAVEANVTKITELETQISNLKKGAGTTTNPVIKDADDTVEEIVNENTVLFKKWNSSKLLYNQIPD